MVAPFEFATAGRVVFGSGKLSELAAAAKGIGKRALLICGRTPERAFVARDLLARAAVETELFSIPGEPEVTVVSRGAELARAHRCDFIVGFGGGSALDGAKAIAALATNTRDVFDYLEVVGKAQPLTTAPLPVIAIPTTAGTGTEVTRNAVLLAKDHGVKVSIRHNALLPRVAIVDPELTRDLPPALTASTGMDALTQLIEPFVSHRANPMTDAVCIEGIRRAAKALPRAFANGHDSDARHDMAVASLFGGIALANAGLGAVHGFAAPIGGMFPAPHGAVCAALLAPVMRRNLKAAHASGHNTTLERYNTVAQLLTNNPAAKAEDGVRLVTDLCHGLNIAPLRTYGLTRDRLVEVADKAAEASSMKANPVKLSREELVDILSEAW